jgi:heavy metal translocating P-type ATPase
MSDVDSELLACDYCGLPLPRSHRDRNPAASQRHETRDRTAEYCCFGCRFAAAVARERADSGHAHWLMARLAIAAFLSMNVMMFSMVLWTRDVYAMEHAAPEAMTLLDELLRYTCLLLSVPVVLLLAGPLVENAIETLRVRRLSTDVLLLLGIAAALAYSVVSVLRDEGHIYFEVACVVLIAITLGRWFEATGKQKTTAALAALERLLPEAVRIVINGRDQSRPLEDVLPGDRIHILAGERVPVDGVVVQYHATLDEQLISGESLPVEKRLGERVYAGTLNLGDDFYVDAVASSKAGALSRIVEAVRTAATRKDRYQSLADRIAAWFTPVVIVIALSTFVYHAKTASHGEGLMAALAVLLIACPCALALATPMAVWTALGAAAQNQVLFRNGEAIVRLAKARHIAFDKTGTLTTGKPRVSQFYAARAEEQEIALSIAAALARGSNHPLSAAIADFVSPAVAYSTDQIVTIAGQGLSATVEQLGDTAYLGSPRWMSVNNLACSDRIENAIRQAQSAGEGIVCVGWLGETKGVFTLAEALRVEAPAAIHALQSRGLALSVLSGDHERRCNGLRQLGLHVRSDLLPEEKLVAIAELRDGDHRRHGVAMVGDGINDAPALAAADVGIALGCGADITRETAGVCLLSDDLMRLPWAIDLARRTVRTIRWNLVFAFVYNVIGIAFAAAGYLNPILAAIAMTASSVLVITNSLRLGHDEFSASQPSNPVLEARVASLESKRSVPKQSPVAVETIT